MHSQNTERDEACILFEPSTDLQQILQLIAEYMTTDQTVLDFGLACKTTHKAITSSVWRKRFLVAFDPLDPFHSADPFNTKGFSPEHYAKVYKARRKIAKDFTTFASSDESRAKQVDALNMVREVVLGTCQLPLIVLSS